MSTINRPDFGNPFVLKQDGTPSHEPSQVGHIRNNASYLLVGNLTDRLYEGFSFARGLWMNLLVLAPWFLTLALLCGRWHFQALHHPILYWVGFSAVIFLIECLRIPFRKTRTQHSLNKLRVNSEWIGRGLLAVIIGAILLSTSYSVELLRDQLRLNNFSLSVTFFSLTGTVSCLGMIKGILPKLASKSASVLAIMLGMLGLAFVYVSFVLFTNWIVYGNPLEITRWFNFLLSWPRWYFGAIALALGTAVFVRIIWVQSNWSVRKFNLLYSIPIVAAAVFTAVLCYQSTETLKQQAQRVAKKIGKFSRPISLLSSLDLKQLDVSEETVDFVSQLRIQKEKIRRRQEYISTVETKDENDFSKTEVETFAMVQAYVDNAAELWELAHDEKYAFRQLVSQTSRSLLRKRAKLAFAVANENVDDWTIAKTLLLESVTLSILDRHLDEWSADGSGDASEELKVILDRLGRTLAAYKVNSLYQEEFVAIYCPKLADSFPTPARSTSYFPGTANLFFDGIADRDSQKAIGLSLGKYLYRTDRKNALINAFKDLQPKFLENIAGEETVRNELLKLDSVALSKIAQQNSRTALVRLSDEEVSLAYIDSKLPVVTSKLGEVLKNLNPIVPNTHDASSMLAEGNTLAPDGRSSTPPQAAAATRRESSVEDKASGLKASMALRLLVERATSLDVDKSADARGLLSRLQEPEPIGETETERLENYSIGGLEKFSGADLVLLGSAPFAYQVATPNRMQQLDYAATAVAFGNSFDIDELADLRMDAFRDQYFFKAFYLSLAILLTGAAAVAFVDVNRTSANEYYRSKLHNTFLTDANGKDLDRRISELADPTISLPYLLINTVANLQASDDQRLRDRRGDFFLISPLYSGCRSSAFVPTRNLEAASTDLKLSTAVAISAAAVSPNMGRYTSPALVWLLSLLNVRLGYWIPNPTELEGNCKLDEVIREEKAKCLDDRRALNQLSAKDPYFGLAFPGGGIRSATFNLGVSQALADAGLMREFDYLSTVSGGGYIGSSIVASMLSSHLSQGDAGGTKNRRHSANEEKHAQQKSWAPPPAMLLKEMFGRLREDNSWLNLSDGGHVENLAVFELLERRCNLIFVGVPEAGPSNPNNGIGILARLARAELGIEIDVDLDVFNLKDDLHCERHWTVGRLHYPANSQQGASTGFIVFLRASMTGDEEAAIREYKERSPMFPHEPTTDQFFDVGQFEAYRLLGIHVVRDFLEFDGMGGKSDGATRSDYRVQLVGRVSLVYESSIQENDSDAERGDD